MNSIFLRKHTEFMTLNELEQKLGDLSKYTFNISYHNISYQTEKIENINIRKDIKELRKELTQTFNEYQLIPGFLKEQKILKLIQVNKLKKDISDSKTKETELIEINKDNFLKSISNNIPSMLIKNNNHPDLLGSFNGSNKIDVIQNGNLFAIYEKDVPDNYSQFISQIDSLNIVFEHQLKDIL